MALLLAVLLIQADTDLKRVSEVLAQAEEAGAGIKEPYLRSKAWALVAETRAESGDVEGTLKLLDRISDPYEKSLGFAAAARALAKSGDGESARRIALLGLKASGEGDKDFKTSNGVAHL